MFIDVNLQNKNAVSFIHIYICIMYVCVCVFAFLYLVDLSMRLSVNGVCVVCWLVFTACQPIGLFYAEYVFIYELMFWSI